MYQTRLCLWNPGMEYGPYLKAKEFLGQKQTSRSLHRNSAKIVEYCAKLNLITSKTTRMMTHNTHWLVSLFWPYHTSPSECMFSAGTSSQVLMQIVTAFKREKLIKLAIGARQKYISACGVKEFFTNANSKWNIMYNWNCGYKRTAPGWLEKRSLARPLRINAKISTSIIRDVAKNLMKLQLVTALHYLTSNLDKNWFARLRTNAADPSLEHIRTASKFTTPTLKHVCMHAVPSNNCRIW